jgi:thioester reductase-like protein
MTFILNATQLLSKVNLPDFSEEKIYLSTEKPTLLLTGATGFLGIHLLEKLVYSNFYSAIYIVVRNKKKIQSQINRYHIPYFSWDNIIIIENDLEFMSKNDFPIVDHVIHSAAEIHCLKNLKQLWQNNVINTEKICQYYSLNSKIFFISSLSVFVSSNIKGNHLPCILPEDNKFEIYGGYAQSKYIAEKIVERHNGNIIRLGLLTGSSYLGKFPENDFFTSIIKALNLINSYPKDYEISFVDLTPVNFCADFILNYIQQSIYQSQPIYHIANKKSVPISKIIKILNLEPVSKELFLEKLNSLSKLSQTLLKYAFFKPEMLQHDIKKQFFNIDLFQSTHHSYNINNDFNISNAILLELYIKNIIGIMHEKLV